MTRMKARATVAMETLTPVNGVLCCLLSVLDPEIKKSKSPKQSAIAGISDFTILKLKD